MWCVCPAPVPELIYDVVLTNHETLPDIYIEFGMTLRFFKAHPLFVKTEVSAFHEAAARVPRSRRVFNNECVDLLAIAAEMLHGEVAYRAGRHDEAFDHLRKAVDLSDHLPYDEPWGWMQPSRHALGALLLEQGEVEEAAAAYRADLGLADTVIRSNQHPDNVWALMGLHDCYQRLGKTSETQMLKPRLDFALARADLPIKASCFCSLKAAAA